MSRFLEADKVLVFKLYDDLTEEFYEKEFTIQNFIDTYAVDGCPGVVDAEPIRHGHWINDGIDKWKCSLCQNGDIYAFKWSVDEGYELQDNYCPNCGALMDKEEEE